MTWQQLKTKIGDSRYFRNDDGELECPLCSKILTKSSWEAFAASWQYASSPSLCCPYCFGDWDDYIKAQYDLDEWFND